MSKIEYLWYRLNRLKGFGPKSINYIYSILTRDKLTIVDFFSFNKIEFSHRFPELGCGRLKSATFISVIEQDEETIKSEYRELNDSGVKIIPLDHKYYPPRLREYMDNQAPPILFVMGNISLLKAKGVSIVGSRSASQEGLNMTTNIASRLGKVGINIVSGYAKGVDTTAHLGSLNNYGTTTIVLSYGILEFVKKLAFRNPEWDDKILVVSQFHPKNKWTAQNAMIRNLLICALSHAVVIIETGKEIDERGRMSGTYSQGRNALRINLPLFVVSPKIFNQQHLGNEQLIKLGGIEIDYENGPKTVVGYLTRNKKWCDNQPYNNQTLLTETS